jgi:hypothetical protein
MTADDTMAVQATIRGIFQHQLLPLQMEKDRMCMCVCIRQGRHIQIGSGS